tara:strand:- start:651 stop:1088 length:438 start_codon:yes stop_codon:yes gene_type:complete
MAIVIVMERNLWHQLNQIQKHKQNYKSWKLTRIETSTINGVPDVHCLISGFSFWLELKANEDKNYGLSKYQIIWQLDYVARKGFVYNLVFAPSQRMLKLVAINPASFSFNHTDKTHKSGFVVLDTIKYTQDNLCKIIKSILIRNS